MMATALLGACSVCYRSHSSLCFPSPMIPSSIGPATRHCQNCAPRRLLFCGRSTQTSVPLHNSTAREEIAPAIAPQTRKHHSSHTNRQTDPLPEPARSWQRKLLDTVADQNKTCNIFTRPGGAVKLEFSPRPRPPIFDPQKTSPRPPATRSSSLQPLRSAPESNSDCGSSLNSTYSGEATPASPSHRRRCPAS